MPRLPKAFLRRIDQHDIAADLILCFLRDLGAGAAGETLSAALPFREHFIGVGLDSAEVGHPPSFFRDVARRASAAGWRTGRKAKRRRYIWAVL